MNQFMTLIPLTFLLGSVHAVAAPQSLRLALRCDQDTLLESQALWVHVALVTRGSVQEEVQPNVLTEDPTTGIRFQLRDDAGVTTTSSGGVVIDRVPTKPSRVIAPNDSITEIFQLLNWFSTSEKKDAVFYIPTQHYLRAGSYVLRAIQFTGKDTLSSNTVRLTVVKPRGKEREALEALARADRKSVENSRGEAAALAYERIVSSFPKSVYAPYAFYRLIFLYHFVIPKQNYEGVFRWLTRLADAFPNHSQTLYVVSTYAPLAVREGKSDVLEKLAQRHSRTKVGELSRLKLEELTAGK